MNTAKRATEEAVAMQSLGHDLLRQLAHIEEQIDHMRRSVYSVLGLADKPELRPIEDLGLTKRTANVLKAEKIYCIAQLDRLTQPQLLKIPGMGRKGLEEIEATLTLHRSWLGTDG